MGFLSGLFSDKKKVESNSNQTGQQSYGLSDEAKNYWSTVAPTFNQGWTPVANDPSQIAAAGAQAGLSSGLNPAFNTATGIGASGISTADIQRFQNPYEDQVVRDTLEDMRYADSQALSQSNAAAAKAGALGGTSGIVRRNLLEDNFQDARNKAVTGIRQAGFNTAADLAAKSTSAQLAGVGAASGIAGQQSGINQTQFGMGTQGWNQAWQNANQPFTVAGQGAQVLAGLSPASGQNTSGTSTGTQTTTASPSLFSVGANLLGAGFAGGWRPFAANGGRIEMADGGAVDGDAPQSQKDPHAKFKSAFDAISSMLERARGGSVSGMAPMRAGGGPVGSWSTTVTPASTFDNKAFGQSLSRMGESKGSGGDDTALLQQQQQALSSMLSGMSGRRAAGGGVWDETGPEFGGSSGIAPPARLGAAPERVERRPLAPPRSTWTGEDEVWQGLRAPQRAAAMGLLEADGRDPVAARNAISAMINRSNRTGEDLGDHVSRAIYQPTIEPAQRARLRSIVASPAFKEMTSFAEDRIYNRVPDPVGGNTHFLAHEPVMERLTAREPGKYRSWPGWTGYAKSGGQYSNPDGSPVIRDKSHAFLSPKGRFDGGDPARDLEENPGPMPPPAPSSTMVASGGARGPVRMASVEPTSSSGAPIATDAPKRGGWFNEGVWTGEKMTPMQRLGIGLMSVRGPMFGGPMNDMAKQLMGMEEGRLNEKRIDSQADQFAKQIAQQAAIAAGRFPDGTPTVASRQADASIAESGANQKLREAEAATKQEAVFLDRAGAVAQAIANDVDPTAAQAKWDALIKADPRYAELLKKGGIDPADHKAGAAYIQSIARGFKEQPKLGVTDLKQGEVKIFYDPKTGKEVGRLEGPGGVLKYEDKIKAEEGLRKEVNTYAKDYTTIRDATSTLERVAKAGTAFSDMATIFQYMKILDPGSVVREGEFANAQNAAGVPDQVVNMYNKALAGNFLNQKQREDIVARARDVATTKRTYYDQRLRQYSDLAKRSGLDPNNVILIEPKTETEANSAAPGTGTAPRTPNPATGLSDDEIKKRLGIP